MVERSGNVNKIIAVVMICLIAVCMSSCVSSPQSDPSQPSSEVASSNEGNGIDVDEGLFDVTITIPSSLVGEDAASELTDEQKEKGFKSVSRNGDGSITYVITKNAHKTIVEDLRTSTAKTMDDIVASGDFASIKKIEYNNDFTEVSMWVDKKAFERSLDGLSALSVWFSGALYQAFNGTESDKLSVTVNVVDEKTDETFKSIKYPDALGN